MDFNIEACRERNKNKVYNRAWHYETLERACKKIEQLNDQIIESAIANDEARRAGVKSSSPELLGALKLVIQYHLLIEKESKPYDLYRQGCEAYNVAQCAITKAEGRLFETEGW